MILQAIDDSILLAIDDAILVDLSNIEPAQENAYNIPIYKKVAVNLQSYNLHFTNGVYLCANDYATVNNYLSTGYFSSYDYVSFANVKTLSSRFEPFYGYKFSEKAYKVLDNNNIQILLPPVAGTTSFQTYNLIVKNTGGYNKNVLSYPPIPSPTPTPSITPTNTPTPSITPTNTPTPTLTPTLL